LRAFADIASVTGINSSGDALTAVASTLLNAKAVHLEGASLRPKQVHAHHLCRVNDEQTVTLNRSWRSDWKTGWEVSLNLEALRECYPLAALDNLVSTYDK
jgi:hypothetical protein